MNLPAYHHVMVNSPSLLVITKVLLEVIMIITRVTYAYGGFNHLEKYEFVNGLENSINILYLVGGIPTPLKNMVSWDDYS